MRSNQENMNATQQFFYVASTIPFGVVVCGVLIPYNTLALLANGSYAAVTGNAEPLEKSAKNLMYTLSYPVTLGLTMGIFGTTLNIFGNVSSSPAFESLYRFGIISDETYKMYREKRHWY